MPNRSDSLYGNEREQGMHVVEGRANRALMLQGCTACPADQIQYRQGGTEEGVEQSSDSLAKGHILGPAVLESAALRPLCQQQGATAARPHSHTQSAPLQDG